MNRTSDYIRRDKVINTIAGITTSMSVCLSIDECHGMKKMQQQAVMEIANMPPEGVQPVVRWIPCSERLPEEDVEVLVTDDAGGITTIDVDRCGMYEDTKERFWYTSQHVIAWMPLPEPWKGADE